MSEPEKDKAEAPKLEFTRKLFNNGARTFQTSVDGRNCETPYFYFHSKKSEAFTDAEADRLLKMYPNEIIDMANVTVENLTNTGVASKLAEQSAKEDAEMEKRFADARAVKKQAAYDAAIKEGFDDAAAKELAGL